MSNYLAFLDQKTKTSAYRMLKKLSLPVPANDEFYSGHEYDYDENEKTNYETHIIFINATACTVRFQHNGYLPLARHPYLTRPIGSVHVTDKWRFDIIQGGRPTANSDAKDVYEQALKDGIELLDIYEGDSVNGDNA